MHTELPLYIFPLYLFVSLCSREVNKLFCCKITYNIQLLWPSLSFQHGILSLLMFPSHPRTHTPLKSNLRISNRFKVAWSQMSLMSKSKPGTGLDFHTDISFNGSSSLRCCELQWYFLCLAFLTPYLGIFTSYRFATLLWFLLWWQIYSFCPTERHVSFTWTLCTLWSIIPGYLSSHSFCY